MVRYLLEHSRALERRELQPVPPNIDVGSMNKSPRAEQLLEIGRYTDFSGLYSG